MKRRLMIYVNFLCGFVCLMATFCWIVSHRMQVTLVWSSGTNHNQIVSFDGAIYFVQNHRWWRREKLTLVIDRQPVETSILEWPGMFLDTQAELAGFTRAKGNWVSPSVLVTKETKFTSAAPSIAPNTMFSSTTRINIFGVPYWFLVLVSALCLAIGVILFRRIAAQSVAIHGADT